MLEYRFKQRNTWRVPIFPCHNMAWGVVLPWVADIHETLGDPSVWLVGWFLWILFLLIGPLGKLGLVVFSSTTRDIASSSR